MGNNDDISITASEGYGKIGDVIETAPHIFDVKGHEQLCSIRLGTNAGGGYIARTGAAPIGVPEVTFHIGPEGALQTDPIILEHNEVVVRALKQANIPLIPTGKYWVRLADVNDLGKAMEVLGFSRELREFLLNYQRDMLETYDRRLQELPPEERAHWPTGPGYRYPSSASLEAPVARKLLPEPGQGRTE
jgi:hypothetical protein